MRRPSVRSGMTLCWISLALASSAAGEVIDFEEVAAQNDPAAVLGREYVPRGVEFVGSDGAVWQGLSAGDPGAFGIEGSRGPSFLGFDGSSFGTAVSFDEAVRNVRFDLARAEGGSFHLFFFLNGYRDGELVDTAATILGDVGAWQEVALVEEVDYIEWWSVGDVRYAVDGLGWDGMAPAVVAVEIDLMPGSERNPIRLGRPGVVPVVLRGSPGLDVGEVVLESLGFGAEPALAVPSRRPAQAVVDDLDGDGWLDLLLHPRVEEMDLLQGDDRVCLVGELSDGGFIEGCDAVTLVGARRR